MRKWRPRGDEGGHEETRDHEEMEARVRTVGFHTNGYPRYPEITEKV